MEWWITLVIFVGGALLVQLTGIPVCFGFMLVNLVGVFLFWGGEAGLQQFILSMFSSVSTFTLLAIPLFTLMGELLLHSGIAFDMFDVIGKWLGRLPGKLSLIAVAMGTLLAALSGSGIATTGILGTLLVPEMEKRGYKKPMVLGPIMASGSLAVMIPPSGLAVLVGSWGGISVGALLIAGIVPGLLMASLYATYIIVRCWLQPSLAPQFAVDPSPLSERVTLTIRYVLPVGLVVFLVTGLIFFGVVTPSEAAATGVLGSVLLIALNGRLNWEVIKKSLLGTLSVTGMIFLIIVGSSTFSQILAFSGASAGMVRTAMDLSIPSVVIVVFMQAIIVLLGSYMDPTSMVMISLPIFMPIVEALNINDVWFGMMFVLNLEMAGLSPPLGSYLYVMKGLAPPGTTMGDVYSASWPFLGLDLAVMALILVFPPIAVWLPSLMH